MIGKTLRNRYRVTAELGKGAMGQVYRATDRQTKEEVALKVIARDLAVDLDLLTRFRREGEALRQLRHRNIVAFVEMFTHLDQQVIVMEYVGGGDLHALIKRGPVPVTEALRITLELSDALAQAHHINIIHRDIKPENVLWSPEGTPKLTDFGVARLVGETGRLTGTGALVGTPYYMSPEAWQGRPLDAQADIWSLGVMLYEMVSGKVPFAGDTLPVVMNKILTEPLPDIREMRPEAAPELVAVIGRMLARDKAERYRSMRQLAADLEECGPGPAARLPAVPSVQPAASPAPAAVAGSAVQLRPETSLPVPVTAVAVSGPKPEAPGLASALPALKPSILRPPTNPPPAATGGAYAATQLISAEAARRRARRVWMWAGFGALALVCLFAGLWALGGNLPALAGAASATPTATLTVLASRTGTSFPTLTRTSTLTPTTTSTETATPTATATPSETSTSTATASLTPTRKPTKRPTTRPVILPSSTPMPLVAAPTDTPAPSGGGGGGGGGGPAPQPTDPPSRPPTPAP